MSEENKAIVRKIQEAWSSGNLDELDQYFSPKFHAHSVPPGMPPALDTAKASSRMFAEALPDQDVEILDMVSDGDRVFVRTRVTGTNQGGMPWFGVGPNGAKIDNESWALYRLEGGQVVESWGVNDAGIMFQLGAIAMPDMPSG
jgi:predicted ester cyclase